MQRVSIVVPCCNEEEAVRLLPTRLFPVLEDLAATFELQLVLVDDGSSDATWAELEAIRAQAGWPTVLAQHSPNRGLGAALNTGCELATGEIVVTLDVDGTYPFPIVERLITAITNGADVATVSPYHRAGGVAGVSPLRLFFSRGASLCYRILVDRRIATYTALVRAYRAEVLHAAAVSHPGFLNVAMTLVEARRRGARVVEIPATLAQREVGVSKARVARITRSHLGYMWQLFLLRITGRFWLPTSSAAPVAASWGAAGTVRHG